MACADVDMDIYEGGEGGEETQCDAPSQPPPPPPVRVLQYQATEMVQQTKGPLHDLMKKQPAVLGALQMVSGLFSFGVGIVFAVTQEMHGSLFTLFRLSLLTGLLYIIAGFVSNLLFKYPRLVHVCLQVNCGCIVVSAVAACMISVDLGQWNYDDTNKMELMELCVLVLEMILSATLCIWFVKEKKRAKSSP